MNIFKATVNDLQTVAAIVTSTIKAVYPNYYPAEVADFFLNHHSEGRIFADLQKGAVYLLREDQDIVATGSVEAKHISRVFVLPAFQGKGYGSLLMDFLEERIAQSHSAAILDASLPAQAFYIKRGYLPASYHQIKAANNRVLCYPVMHKLLPYLPREAAAAGISYDGKRFTAIENSENGEVSQATVFCYRQEDNLLWADYSGGEIVKGFLVGSIDTYGNLSFTYQHVNRQGDARMGKCYSVPELLPDGRLRLHERWQWLNGDCSCGSSTVEEIKTELDSNRRKT